MKKIFKNILVASFIFLMPVSSNFTFADEVLSTNQDNSITAKNIEQSPSKEVKNVIDTVASGNYKISHEKGIVKAIIEREATTDDVGDVSLAGIYNGKYTEQILHVELLTGEHAGKMVEITNNVYKNPFAINVKKGDKLFLYGVSSDGEFPTFSIMDYWHSDGLVVWSFIFLILVIVLGGFSGIKAIFSLFMSVVFIFGIFVPLIKDGSMPFLSMLGINIQLGHAANPVVVALIISAVIIVVTHLIITGTGRKSWAAMLGTMSGVLFGALMMYLVASSSNITGLGSAKSRDLAANFPNYDFKGLLYAGIILGALGAVMDTGISIASGMNEVKHHSPTISRKNLMKSGFRMGKDILGSMINTLVFAYIGTSLVSILMFLLLDSTSLELLNYGFIAEEVVRSLVGSLGLLATIPLTAIISAYLLSGKKLPAKVQIKQVKNV